MYYLFYIVPFILTWQYSQYFYFYKDAILKIQKFKNVQQPKIIWLQQQPN